MADTRFANVRAGFTTVNVSGGFEHESLGKADLIFTDTNLTFGDVVIAYDEMESPKLLIARLFFVGHIRLNIVIGDKQFWCVLRTNPNTLESVPVEWEISENRRRWENFFFGYMIFCVIGGLAFTLWSFFSH